MPNEIRRHAAPFTLEEASVLLPVGIERTSVAVAAGNFVGAADGRGIDARGFLILPGIVDVHGDGFERHLAPRRGALRSMDDGLRAVEAELASCGITTAWLAQFWSWQGGMRGPDFARGLSNAIAAFDATLDLRLQLRLEKSLHADFDAVRALVAEHEIDAVVLADHLPHVALAAGKKPARMDGQALRAGRSPAAHLAVMQALHDGMEEAQAKLPDFVTSLAEAGVMVGSHDDETAWDGDLPGIRVSEFPVSIEAAQAARESRRGIVLGAPNVVRGGSHGRGVRARDLIDAGLCDALASDYHYPSLAQAAFALADDGVPMRDAWALVSSGPARLLGLTDRGSIEEGNRADFVIVEEKTRRIVGTVAGGRFAWIGDPLGDRLIRVQT